MELHAMCLTSYPPIIYMNGHSLKIIEKLNELNWDEIKIAYTMDAGPNIFLFYFDDSLLKSVE